MTLSFVGFFGRESAGQASTDYVASGASLGLRERIKAFSCLGADSDAVHLSGACGHDSESITATDNVSQRDTIEGMEIPREIQSEIAQMPPKIAPHVRYEPSIGCLVWTRAITSAGYGNREIAGKCYLIHRLVWAHINGPIPDGLHILHSCDNPPCCRPAHLRVGTIKDNAADRSARNRLGGTGGINARKTHCNHGHEFTPENTERYHGDRVCIACKRSRKRKQSPSVVGEQQR